MIAMVESSKATFNSLPSVSPVALRLPGLRSAVYL